LVIVDVAHSNQAAFDFYAKAEAFHLNFDTKDDEWALKSREKSSLRAA
jgi:hypothetical protein